MYGSVCVVVDVVVTVVLVVVLRVVGMVLVMCYVWDKYGADMGKVIWWCVLSLGTFARIELNLRPKAFPAPFLAFPDIFKGYPGFTSLNELLFILHTQKVRFQGNLVDIFSKLFLKRFFCDYVNAYLFARNVDVASNNSQDSDGKCLLL